MRRFKFNEKTEAVDKIITDQNPKTRKSHFEWKKIHLFGMAGKPSPGPGEYRSPSEFGQYVSEKFLLSGECTPSSPSPAKF